MEAAILTIGDEILIGQIVDTNSAWLGQKLSEIGIKVKKIFSLGDQKEEIIKGLSQAISESDMVIITGGLGPTKDDITKVAIAEFLGVELFFHHETYERIKRIFEKIGKQMSSSHDSQCFMPEGVTILKNSMGTAPGMLFNYKNKKIISLPGVPYEMKAIMEEVVLPMLVDESVNTIIHKTILTCCTGETVIENRISDLVSSFPPELKIAYLPSLAQVRLRLTATGNNLEAIQKMINYYTDGISERLSDVIFGYDDSSLENELQKLCISKGLTIALAESCTGGHISSKIVSVPGSSEYYLGGMVAYSDEIKKKLLHVSEVTLHNYGAVSEETVKEMVDGTIRIFNCDAAISVSGIAGPGGGSTEKPVGTIWICVGNNQKKETFLLKAGKDRNKNIEIASIYALDLLRRFIIKNFI